MNVDRLAVALDHLRPVDMRGEPREEVVRIVEYSQFPRVARHAGPRIGFTRDLSTRGMCIGADEPEDVGSLLRVTVRGVDGRAGQACVERVVWCQSSGDGRHWIGLERLAGGDTR